MNQLKQRMESLSPEKRRLMESKLKSKGIESVAAGYRPILPIPKQDHYPLSSAQRRLFILEQFEGIGTSYNIMGAYWITGDLDRNRLQSAILQLIQRHESLRTSFAFEDGEPVQRIHPTAALAIDYVETTAAELETHIAQFIQPFDLSQAPLMRIRLLVISSQKYLLLIDMHHIIADGTSMAILVEEFIHLYHGDHLPELRIQYKDYAAWQRDLQKDGAIQKQEQYWLEQFSGEIPVLNLPLDYPRPATQSFEGARMEFKLGAKLTEGLKALCSKTGATVYMVLLAVFNVLLSKYTGQEDIIVGTPVAGRPHVDLERIIGFFINTLAMRNFPVGTHTFQKFLNEVKEHSLKGFENQNYPFEELIEKLNLQRDLSRNPLFDVMFVLQNANPGSMEMKRLRFTPYPFEVTTTKFDLTLEAIEIGGEILCSIDYCVKLMKPETITRLSRHLLNILQTVTTNPECALQDIELLSETEKRQILEEFNATQALFPKGKTIYQLFEAQVSRNPNQIAVIFEEQQLTYIELNRKANRLARKLRAAGVSPNQPVGIMVERSLQMMIGLLAILKAGGAYLPMNPNDPDERRKYQVKDAGLELLLTQPHLVHKTQNLAITVIDLENPENFTGDPANPDPVNGGSDLVYIIYTSGSTGNPKGAMIEHDSLVNRLAWMQKQYPLSHEDVILQKTPITFDVSLWELFWWSLSGARVVVLKPGGEKEPETITAAIEKNQVTTIHFVPSMFNLFLEYSEESHNIDRLQSLKYVFTSGEALAFNHVRRFRNLFQHQRTQLHNLYGPTEATVDVSYFDCSYTRETEPVPIGKPIDNHQLLIFNRNYGLQPIGIPGELCISGVGLARGYLNRPELTAEKFVKNPMHNEECIMHNEDREMLNEECRSAMNLVHPGKTENSGFNYELCIMNYKLMYKTGDLTRWAPDGNIEFLGRIDHQVKIRGNRIELGEIETQLLNHEHIKEAAVIVREDGNGDKYLCAYIVPGIASEPERARERAGELELTIADLRAYLGKVLPDYMIPSVFIPLERLPLTSSGKVDRKAFSDSSKWPDPAPNRKRENEYVAPRTEAERGMVEIWEKVLPVKTIGVFDDFFESGGHSLYALEIVSAAKKQGLNISIQDIFRYRTIAMLMENVRVGPDDPQVQLEAASLGEGEAGASGRLDQKQLPILLQREISTYLNYSLPLCIILADEKMRPWFYQHFIQLTAQIGRTGAIALDYVELFVSYWDIVRLIHIPYLRLDDGISVLEMTKEKIREGFYVYAFLDEYYLPVKLSYQKNHFVHETLIYGYDDRRQKLQILGFGKEEILDFLEIDYDHFIYAFDSSRRHYKESAPYAKYGAVSLFKLHETAEKYTFDPELFINDLKEYTNSYSAKGISSAMMPQDESPANFGKLPVVYGLNIYGLMGAKLQDLLQGRVMFDYRAIHLMAEHKSGLYQRLNYFYSRYANDFSDCAEKIVSLLVGYEEVVREIQGLRIKFMDQALRPRNSFRAIKSLVKEMIGILSGLQQKEERILRELVPLFEAKVRESISL